MTGLKCRFYGNLCISRSGSCCRCYSQGSEGGIVSNIHNSDSVNVLCKQGQTHNCKSFRNSVFVIALRMESDQVRFSGYGIYQTSTDKVALIRVNVVQHDIFNRCSNHTASGNFCLCQKEDRVESHEILNILETELILNRNVRCPQIFIYIHDVHKPNGSGSCPVHCFEFILHKPLCHCQSHLESGLCCCQSTGVQVIIESTCYVTLELEQKFIVCHLNSVFIAMVFNCLDGNGLCVFLNGHFRIFLFFYNKFAVRDFLALANISAFKGSLCIFAFQDSARLLFNRAHDTQNIPQVFPIPLKPGDKIQFTSGYLNISSLNQIVLCRHFILLYRISLNSLQSQPDALSGL